MSNTEKLVIKYFKVKQLVHLEGNPRKSIDPKGRERLSGLIKTHGFQNPLQVFKEKNGKFSIICGNHRFDAGKNLGMKEFPCIVYTGSRKKAIARAISDNKSNEWTDWDAPLLKDAFADLDDGVFNLEFTGFEQVEVDKLFGHYTEKGSDQSGQLSDTKYFVVVQCKNEKDQKKKIKEFMKAGLEVKSVTS